jgi:hypothetical protein
MKSAMTKWSCILTITSFAMPSENWIDWSAIYNCIYVGNKGSLSNKYSYVNLDIMLTSNPMSQVLWKILCLIVHSIVGTPRLSFLARNGEVWRWSYSDRSVLIILTVFLMTDWSYYSSSSSGYSSSWSLLSL